MDRLIWFSMPGAVLVPAIVACVPELSNFKITEGEAVLLAITIPFVGFVLHQVYRMLFEATGSFARGSRPVIRPIQQEYSASAPNTKVSRKDAFLIWEITFYSEPFPNSFREHDRGAWHYVFSFWSVSFAALIAMASLVLCGLPVELNSVTPIALHPQTLLLVGELAMFIVFYIKGKQTFDSLMRQEVAAFWRHRHAFDQTADAILQ